MSWSRRLEARFLRALPLGALERAVRRGVVGLFYHTVSEERLPHVAPLYRYRTPAQFEADLAWLARRYRFVTAAEAEHASADRGRPAVHLSFDDGFVECHTVVRPILLRMGIPCTFFLVDGALDNRLLPAPNLAALCMEAAGAPRALAEADPARIRAAAERLGVDARAYLAKRRPFLTTAQARELAADGFELGAHTRAHTRLATLPPGEAEREVSASCAAIAALAGARSVPFAFPVSGAGVDPAFPAAVRARHPQVGAFFDTGWLRRGAPGVVHRIPADPPPRLTGPGAEEQLRRGYWKALTGRS